VGSWNDDTEGCGSGAGSGKADAAIGEESGGDEGNVPVPCGDSVGADAKAEPCGSAGGMKLLRASRRPRTVPRRRGFDEGACYGYC